MSEKFQNLGKETVWRTRELEFSRVTQYLNEREKEEGGFSLVSDLYPDVEDTYYAIRTLQLLKIDINRSKTANYLKSIHWTDVSFPRAVYRIVYLHLSAGIELPTPLVDLLKKDWSRFQPLDVQYYFNEIRKLLNQSLNPMPSLSVLQFRPQESLQSLHKRISILLDLNIDFDRQEIIR